MSQTFIPETKVGKLQVEEKFKSLIAVATGPDSAYIHAKESMQSYFASSEDLATLTQEERTMLLSKFVSDLALGITGKMIDAAIKITTEDRDAPYVLSKLIAEVVQTKTQTAKIETDDKLQSANIKKIEQDIKATKLEMYYKQALAYSKTGMKLLASGQEGVIASYVQNADATDIVSGKSTSASTYATLASSYRKDGVVTGTGNDVPLTEGNAGFVGLTTAQTRVSIRNEKGFDDNMLQHAVNSSANLMGLMLSSENGNLLSGTPTGIIPETYLTALTKLSGPALPPLGFSTVTETVTDPGADGVLGTADDVVTSVTTTTVAN